MYLEVVAETLLNEEFCSLERLRQHLLPSGMQLLYCSRVPDKVFIAGNQFGIYLSGAGVSEGGAISEAWTAPMMGEGRRALKLPLCGIFDT